MSLLAALVDFGGTLIVLISALACLRDYLRARGAPVRLDALRIRLAQGLVFALSFKTGAGLIRTIIVGESAGHVWHRLGTVFFIIALRFFLGRALKAEIARVSTRSSARPSG